MRTDLSNWRDPGHNIWGFQNVDKIITTDPINKSQNASALDADVHSFEDFEVVDSDGTPLNLAAFLTATQTDGIVVLKNGKIVLEHYGRTNDSASKHALFSISKSVTGLICGILIQEGKLVLEAAASQYIPELTGSSFENLTIRQLLDMRAGMEFEEGNTEYRKATGLVPLKPEEKITNLHEYIPTVKVTNSAPVEGLDGPPFCYLSINADLMGWIVERVEGETFAEVLHRLIWQPMGAENDAYTMVDSDGNARTSAGLCATVRDLARLGRLLLKANGDGIIPEWWIQDTMDNGCHAAYAAGPEEGEFEDTFDRPAYRNYWIADRGSQTLMASGTNGQILLVDRKEGVVMAKTSSQPDKTNWDKIRLTLRAFREFERILV